MNRNESEVPGLARRVAERLAVIPGVKAVALGGSFARGDADRSSDIDLGIYYRTGSDLDIEGLRKLAADLDPAHGTEAATPIGGWGDWINGGAWLTVDGRSMDWIYRDLDRVERVVDECVAGRTAAYYQPGHPHAFHSHIYMGEVAGCIALQDPSGELDKLKARTVPYPSALKAEIIERYLWEAAFAISTARKAAQRNDVWYVSGALFRCVACLVQVLFAANERYFTNEKGAIRQTEGLARRPVEFGDIVRRVAASPGRTVPALLASLAELDRLRSRVEAVARSTGSSV